MDLSKTISDLYKQKEKLERTITALEELVAAGYGRRGPSQPKRRGRKFMGSEERRIVSERMRNYWEKQRAAKASDAGRRR